MDLAAAPREQSGSADILGRETEVQALAAFLDGLPAGARALALRGEAGIGKTAIWEAGLATARSRGMLVLSTRADAVEGRWSFSGLGDILEAVDSDVFAALPAPQRAALDVALLRAEPGARPPQPHAIGSAVLRVIRRLATAQPVIVAVDDAQWLDGASSDAIAFVARRLRPEPVGFLLTERAGHAVAVRRAMVTLGLDRTDIPGLSFGAARHLLATRLGLDLRRHAMRRVYEATRGNPLFLLEIGRSLAGRTTTDADGNLTLPADVDDLLGVRLDGLPERQRTVLLAAALGSDLRLNQLIEVVGADAIDETVEAGLLVVEDDRVRPFHPLVSEILRSRSQPRGRREMHARLAEASRDATRAARHLALATSRPDESVAATVAAEAARSADRGARSDAVELARHALRLTPAESTARHERMLALGETLDRSGDFASLRALLEPAVDLLPAGPLRARGHVLLLGGSPSVETFDLHLDRALEDSDGYPEIRARVLAERAIDMAVSYLRDLPAAERLASEAHGLSTAAEPRAAVGWTRVLRGLPLDDLLEQDRVSVDAEIYYSVRRLAGIQYAFRGEVERARSVFDELIQLAEDRGEEWSYSTIRHQLAELALRAGDLAAADGHISDVLLAPDNGIGTQPHAPRLRAVFAAVAGDAAETARWAAEAGAATARLGHALIDPNWDVLEVARAVGLAAIVGGDAQGAVDQLGAVWDHTEREGIDDPGAFPVAPDLVEALVALGQLERARAVVARLARLADAQAHPWGLASVARCLALLAPAADAGEIDPASTLHRAADAYLRLGLRFDHARTLLLAGRAERRSRRRSAARTTLETAARTFEGQGSHGWARVARAELDRITGTGDRSSDGLTRSERRVAELAADGLSNRAIAATLFIGEHTVEVHLSRAYAKLGIRSRAGLARRLAERTVGTSVEERSVPEH